MNSGPENVANMRSIIPLPKKIVMGTTQFFLLLDCSGFHEERTMAGIDNPIAAIFLSVTASLGSNNKKMATGMTMLNFAEIEVTVMPFSCALLAIN